MKYFYYAFILVLFISACQPKQENTSIQFPGKPEVPASIKNEHENLLDKIHKLTLYKDSTGHVAIKLDELIQHHFKEEEDFVLPPLGLLPLISDGKLPIQGKEIILLTEKLKSQLLHIKAEHQLIKAYVEELMHAAAMDNHPEVIEFEKELHKHATTEEEIFFPSAILVGEYLKLKLVSK